MTLNACLLWSLMRCLIVASVAAWPVGAIIARIEASPTVRSRRLRFLLSVFPFFLPELLIGFNYRLTATQLTSGASPLTAAICTEALYSLLMLCRGIAIGVAVSMLLSGRNANDESLHTWFLLRTRLSSSAWWSGWLRLRISGAWCVTLVSWSVMALVTFQEFETAALMQIDRYPVSWSVWLFDAHAARLPLGDSLKLMIAPLFCELLMLCPALCVLFLRPKVDGNSPIYDCSANGPGSVWKSARFSALLTPGIVLFALWPLINNAIPIIRGVMLMRENSALGQSIVQILTSIGFAIGATVLSMGVAFLICSAVWANAIRTATIDAQTERFGAGHWLNTGTGKPLLESSAISLIGYRVFLLSLLLPGLLGSLVLSLGLLAVFQVPVMRGLYDTWLPMLLGQALAVLPFAVVVVMLLLRVSDPAALHSTQLLAVSEKPRIRHDMAAIRWRLTTGRWLLGGLVIVHRCFWDVTVASNLRPVQIEPVITRLYNEMHYGRTEALISLSLLAALTPLVIAGAAMLLSCVASGSTALR